MPVPAFITDLDNDPNNNYPEGTEPVFPNLDDYLRAHAAFIKQLDEKLDAQWPVGSIYMNYSSSANPGSFLPGSWSKITEGVLYAHGAPGAGNQGDTGGSDSITLAESQLPAHKHSFSATTGTAGNHSHSGTAASAGSHSHSTGSAGGHTHTRGSMNITGQFGARKTGLNTVSGVVGNPSGAFGVSGSVGGKVGRVNVYDDPTDTRDKVTFNAASSWSGSTSSAGSHTHSVNSAGAHTHNISTNTTGNHTHSVSGNTGNTGSGDPINILPPHVTVYIWRRVS